MNLTATMAKNPQPFRDAARNDAHAWHAAILACDSKEDLYSEARALGLSDQEIIANRNAELHEESDLVSWGNGDCEIEIADDYDPAWDAKMSGRPSDEEIAAVIDFVESQDC